MLSILSSSEFRQTFRFTTSPIRSLKALHSAILLQSRAASVYLLHWTPFRSLWILPCHNSTVPEARGYQELEGKIR